MSKQLNSQTTRGRTFVFVLVIFLSAFLLFQVQPVIARFILPWYGGSSSVWSACMLFFQVGLVIGYAYAHLLVTCFGSRRSLQVIFHLAIVALALFNLPITPDPELKPTEGNTSPTVEILKLLAKTVGIPYIILSASGPLVQSWFSGLFPDRSAFRLYAVSNAGSLLALLTYPFLFEVYFPVSQQSIMWSSTFVIYALALGVAAFIFAKNPGQLPSEGSRKTSAGEDQTGIRPSATHHLRWISFSACGSVLLISITNKLCEDTAVIPFLWIAPLALYLLTFIIAFDHSRWYSRRFAISALVVATGLLIVQMNNDHTQAGNWSIPLQITVLCATLFFACLVCHGEIVKLKPPPSFLTEFYLAISIGGALGGVFVNLVAPKIFTGYWELHLGLLFLALLISIQLLLALKKNTRKSKPSLNPSLTVALSVAWLVALIGLTVGLKKNMTLSRAQAIAASRGFFGVLKVTEKQIPGSEKFRSLFHGKTIHGLQFQSDARRRVATAYFHLHSGVGSAFEFLPKRQEQPIRAGVLGLGIGTLATYARENDYFRFYEINPQVIDFARSHFTYLEDCRGQNEVILGDGRISLENEVKSGKRDPFDLLIIDAFSGHAPPIHLLTEEAFEVYFSSLTENGILALNISNAEIDFSDPIRNQAERFDAISFQVIHLPKGGIPSIWVLVTKNEIFANRLQKSGRTSPWARAKPKKIFWTDDFSNLLQALR